jgi:hypothetical protein
MFTTRDYDAIAAVRRELSLPDAANSRVSITTREIVAALQRAGICGLVHDGTRAGREIARALGREHPQPQAQGELT